jgi:hypothetical protein
MSSTSASGSLPLSTKINDISNPHSPDPEPAMTRDLAHQSARAARVADCKTAFLGAAVVGAIAALVSIVLVRGQTRATDVPVG